MRMISTNLDIMDSVCGVHSIYISDPSESVSFNVISDYKAEEKYIAAMVRNEDGSRDAFFISIEKPMFIQKPTRILTSLEKDQIFIKAKKYWQNIISEFSSECDAQCCEKRETCIVCDEKFPLTPPDYTLLPDY